MRQEPQSFWNLLFVEDAATVLVTEQMALHLVFNK